VKVTAKHINDPERLADLDIVVFGSNLHAPVLERILEIPIDIYDGVSFPLFLRVFMSGHLSKFLTDI
jgi:hypothetical protein